MSKSPKEPAPHPFILRPLVALLHKIRARRAQKSKSLSHTLASATRINPPPADPKHPDPAQDTDYCHPTHNRLSRLVTQVHGDGLWKCCNGHEQELVHWSGVHPFKYLVCQRCEHVLCEKCCTTGVLEPVEWYDGKFVQVDKVKRQRRKQRKRENKMEGDGVLCYGQVCGGCGLSHRARVVKTVIDDAAYETVPTLSFDGQMCACGKLADESWVKFKIGPIEEYRRDPHNAFADLSIQRAEGSVKMQLEGVDRSASSSSAVSLAPEEWEASPVEEGHANASTSSVSIMGDMSTAPLFGRADSACPPYAPESTGTNDIPSKNPFEEPQTSAP